MSSNLEEQVQALPLALPEGFISRLLARAAASAPKPAPPRWKSRKLAASLAIGSLFVGANVAAAGSVPDYADIIRSLPFVPSNHAEQTTRAAGIPEQDVLPHGTSLAVGEFLFDIVGTYADDYRTTVLMTAHRNPAFPASAEGPPSFTGATIHLKDSVGRSYRLRGGVGEAGYGSTAALDFEPLMAGVADEGPIMLVISNLDIDLGENYGGTWEIEVSFERQAAPALQLPPAPLVSGDTKYVITSIVASGFRLVVEWQATGPAVERLAEFRREYPPDSWREHAQFDWLVHQDEILSFSLWPQLFDSEGLWVAGSRSWNGEIVDNVYYGFQEIELPAPGEYKIRFGQFTEAGEWDYTSSDAGWTVKIHD